MIYGLHGISLRINLSTMSTENYRLESLELKVENYDSKE
jgi:hypothetical protein